MTLDEITAYLHQHIPLSQHLGAAVEAYDGASLRLGAPLAPNLNHRSTAFGGSLSALAILSGWTLLHLNLRERAIEPRHPAQRLRLPGAGGRRLLGDLDAPRGGRLGALPGDAGAPRPRASDGGGRGQVRRRGRGQA